jgi:hypothetical protein
MAPSGTAVRLAALSRHNAALMLREPGPVLSRLIMPLLRPWEPGGSPAAGAVPRTCDAGRPSGPGGRPAGRSPYARPSSGTGSAPAACRRASSR